MTPKILLLSSLLMAQQPPLPSQEGSLWDYLDGAKINDPPETNEQPSDELIAREESAELYDSALFDHGPPISFYDDPSKILTFDPLYLDEIDPNDFDIPIDINDDVIRWMKYFLGPGRKYYSRWLGRSTQYWPMMHSKLEAAGLPKDLVYLSMIESGYITHAYSSAAAVGLWQFIAPTGKEHDLRIDWWVDERRHPEMATDAAIVFLGNLRKSTGHWYLAWAGYNGGPSRVRRAVKRHGTKDFWTLVEKNSFPTETDNYVPKIIAAAIIGKYRERYGFTNIKYLEPLQYETVGVDANISIEVLAKCASLSEEDFGKYNPQLRRWALPPTPKSQTIYVPNAKTFKKKLAKVPPQARLSYKRYTVKRGDTLSSIAARHGTTVQVIQSTNRISNPNRLSVGTTLLIPPDGMQPVSSPKIKSKSNTSSSSKKSTPKRQTVTHTVQRGQALSAIAEQYGVSTKEVMAWNGIKNANRIYAGQKLKIKTTKSIWITYTVRSGDTLSGIAEKNGVSVAELRAWNNLKSTRIYAGQKLKVKK